MMNICKPTLEYLQQAVDLAYESYLEECDNTKELYKNDYKDNLRDSLEEVFKKGNGAIYIDDGSLIGYMVYNGKWAKDNETNIFFPVWGYGARKVDKEKILSRIFQYIAEKECGKSKVHFGIKLYSHDESIIRLFTFMQFGIQCLEAIRFTETIAYEGNQYLYQELTKVEINQFWEEIIILFRNLVDHLKKSPIFYPGTEFTDDVYRGYIMDESTRLFVAKKNNKIIGIIDVNKEGNSFITNEEDTYNIGDIFVVEEYRGDGVAQGLLKYANDLLKSEGINRLWVEHGTANPNARGFWDKYFNPYLYTMIRDI